MLAEKCRVDRIEEVYFENKEQIHPVLHFLGKEYNFFLPTISSDKKIYTFKI